MLQPEDIGRAVAFVAGMPRVCMNEILTSPTWNRVFCRLPPAGISNAGRTLRFQPKFTHGQRRKKFQTCENLFTETGLETFRNSAQRQRSRPRQTASLLSPSIVRRTSAGHTLTRETFPCPSVLHFCPPSPSARWL